MDEVLNCLFLWVFVLCVVDATKFLDATRLFTWGGQIGRVCATAHVFRLLQGPFLNCAASCSCASQITCFGLGCE